MKFKMVSILLALMMLVLIMTACSKRNPISLSSSLPSSSKSSTFSSSIPSSTSSVTQSSSSMPSSSKTAMSADFAEIGALDGKSIVWGPGTQKDKNGRPVAPIQLQEKYGKYKADFIAPMNGKVYLTFDEGYENGYTAAILDTLKAKDVTGVFFVTLHYVKTQPELVRRMISEGHIIGNHSANHPNYTSISLEKATEETFTLHDYIKGEFGYEMYLFRPPEGAFSQQSLALLDSFGYRTVFWSFAYNDWDPANQMGYNAAYKKVTENIHDGAIILMHAVGKDNSQILGPVIDYVRQKGYQIARYDLGE